MLFYFNRNNIHKLIEDEKQKFPVVSFNHLSVSCENLSRNIFRLNIARNNETDIRDMKREVDQLEENANNFVKHCNNVFPIVEEIKKELYKIFKLNCLYNNYRIKIYKMLVQNKRIYNLEKEKAQYTSLDRWLKACLESQFAVVTKEECQSKYDEAKQITENVNISIQEGKKLVDCHKDRVDELYYIYISIYYENNRQKFMKKISKSKYNVSSFQSKCNEIQQVLKDKTPLNSTLDDYIDIKDEIDELVDKYCAFTEEKQKIETDIVNLTNILYFISFNIYKYIDLNILI